MLFLYIIQKNIFSHGKSYKKTSDNITQNRQINVNNKIQIIH